MCFRRSEHSGFTLIELLAVVVIIVILAGLVLAIANLVMNNSARSLAKTEIGAMSAALEHYKSENGFYPDDGTYSGTNYVPRNTGSLDPTRMGNPTASNYTSASLVLYRALSGDRNCDGKVDADDESLDIGGNPLVPSLTTPPPVYHSFKPGELSISGTGVGSIKAIADPFGYSYGYSTAYAMTGSNGYNPSYDLWSTAGNIVNGPPTSTDTAKWITNW